MNATAIEFSTVLVPLDGSALAEHAMGYAARFAGPAGRLVLTEVLPPPERVFGLFGDVIAEPDLIQRIGEEGAKRGLESVVTRWRALAPNITVEVRTGEPAEQILAAAEAHGCGLVTIASHGRGGLGRWTYGSVADAVLRRSERPVLVIRPNGNDPAVALPTVRQVLVPLDGSSHAERALPAAEAVASRFSVPIRVVTVVDADAIRAATVAGTYGSLLLAQSLEDDETLVGEYLDGRVAELRAHGLTASGALHRGQPAATLLGLADPETIVVMTSHGRGGLKRMLLGSVADKMVRLGESPVMLVPQRGSRVTEQAY